MSDRQFVVQYNGHATEVTALENDTYLVQVTYKPLKIHLQKSIEGHERWVEAETQLETYLSRELGKLIASHLCLV